MGTFIINFILEKIAMSTRMICAAMFAAAARADNHREFSFHHKESLSKLSAYESSLTSDKCEVMFSEESCMHTGTQVNGKWYLDHKMCEQRRDEEIEQNCHVYYAG